METIQVLFSRKQAIGALALRTFLWSAWSHCSIVTKEDTVVEAVGFHGVQEVPLDEAISHYSYYKFVTFYCHDANAIIKAARSQIGKPYDWSGVAGIGFRRRWQDSDSWFCSELVAWAFAEGGTSLMRTDTWRITPRDLYIPRFGRPEPLK